ncbi:abh1, partial [Symbiodinium microadriaticum]
PEHDDERQEDLYHRVESKWRAVRDYESLLRAPLSEEDWVQELLVDPEADARCVRVEGDRDAY